MSKTNGARSPSVFKHQNSNPERKMAGMDIGLRSRAKDWRLGSGSAALYAVALCLLINVSVVRATPTQEEVFRSISSNVDNKVDGRKLLGFFAAVAGGVILLVVINNRQQQQVVPKVNNNQGKLLRELMKAAGLKSSQIRQLKSLSADLANKGEPVKNLTTLLLCPSLIKKARDPGSRERIK